MMRFLRQLQQEWLLVAEIVAFGLFAAGDASGAFETVFGVNIPQGWVVVGAILIIGVTVLLRIGRMRDELARYQADVRITARIGSFAANHPDPGPDKASIRAHVFWEMWVNRDVSVDQVGLNIIYMYDRRWWQFWKKTRFPQVGIPPNGQETTEFRFSVHASQPQPRKVDAALNTWKALATTRAWSLTGCSNS